MQYVSLQMSKYPMSNVNWVYQAPILLRVRSCIFCSLASEICISVIHKSNFDFFCFFVFVFWGAEGGGRGREWQEKNVNGQVCLQRMYFNIATNTVNVMTSQRAASMMGRENIHTLSRDTLPALNMLFWGPVTSMSVWECDLARMYYILGPRLPLHNNNDLYYYPQDLLTKIYIMIVFQIAG